MRVHQCPKCELRFPHEAELKGHLRTDHGLTGEQVAEPLRGVHSTPRPPDPTEGTSHTEP
ncbi:hypothetical protein BH20ACT9_BH20ACT9_06450 [soil metagenome]